VWGYFAASDGFEEENIGSCCGWESVAGIEKEGIGLGSFL
jgi:hypothetical protein